MPARHRPSRERALRNLRRQQDAYARALYRHCPQRYIIGADPAATRKATPPTVSTDENPQAPNYRAFLAGTAPLYYINRRTNLPAPPAEAEQTMTDEPRLGALAVVAARLWAAPPPLHLPDFLRARLQDDEDYARNAYGNHNDAGPHWYEQWSGALNIGEDEDLVSTNDSAISRHMERHDPARVLAEVEAKRRLLDDLLAEKHQVVEDCWYTCPAATEEHDGDETCNENVQMGRCNCGRDDRIGRRLRLLALPYAAHPDYRAEWRP
jgi:hypothetical protein